MRDVFKEFSEYYDRVEDIRTLRERGFRGREEDIFCGGVVVGNIGRVVGWLYSKRGYRDRLAGDGIDFLTICTDEDLNLHVISTDNGNFFEVNVLMVEETLGMKAKNQG